MPLIKKIKNKLGQIIYPETLTKAVYDENGNRLDNILSQSNLVNYKRVLLWENPNPNNDTFASQTINLLDDISNYECYEILYKIMGTQSSIEISTGLINVGKQTIFETFYGWAYRRAVTGMTGNTMSIGDCSYYKDYGSTTSEIYNNYLVPLQVYGYKEV